MVEQPCVRVTTIGGWQAGEIVKSLEAIQGVTRVDAADEDLRELVVAIEGKSAPDRIIREIGRVSGVIRADPIK